LTASRATRHNVYSMQISQRQNLGAELAETLRRMISEGQLAEGTRINEVHLAGRLGVSRTPLREALAMLVAEEALDARPRRGTFVRPLTRTEFLQIYSVRPLLDVGALRMAGLPSEEVIEQLEVLNDRLGAEGDALQRIIIDDEWHLRLVAGCDNPVLLNLIRQFMRRTRRYELAYLKESRYTQTATDEHLAIMAALSEQNLDAACDALQTNLTSGIDPILSWLDKRKTQ